MTDYSIIDRLGDIRAELASLKAKERELTAKVDIPKNTWVNGSRFAARKTGVGVQLIPTAPGGKTKLAEEGEDALVEIIEASRKLLARDRAGSKRGGAPFSAESDRLEQALYWFGTITHTLNNKLDATNNQ